MKAKVFKGIEYVQISDLPADQQKNINDTLNKNIIIKILVGDKILHDCIQFKDYVAWFENIYKYQEAQIAYPGSVVPYPADAALAV